MGSFETFWEYLQKNLKAGTVIKNWTVDKGYLNDAMIIKALTTSAIYVETPNAKYVQSVPKEDFERVFEVWEDYKVKNFKRSEVRDITRYSKYIISIIDWWEQEILKEN